MVQGLAFPILKQPVWRSMAAQVQRPGFAAAEAPAALHSHLLLLLLLLLLAGSQSPALSACAGPSGLAGCQRPGTAQRLQLSRLVLLGLQASFPSFVELESQQQAAAADKGAPACPFSLVIACSSNAVDIHPGWQVPAHQGSLAANVGFDHAKLEPLNCFC